ncbi:Protein disulfide-isomerase A6 [Seminavis robusta]|uniref:protein disulfide-isomerase n=1 Tax=Seminavis robusta TaxID=568900 RepID=A0A9N8H914_9STRA|nr:Protein disulfide-isomerase A6 [Seminavis robusta]|eukprot:Sro239_g095760.1 Protein disulfide-isomerase A6 (476) ;mRNA; f:12414-13972
MMMLSKQPLLLIAILGIIITVAVSASSSWYDDKEHVTVLENLQHFQETVVASPNLWMIQFCSANDENCQKMVPNYEVMGNMYRSLIYMGVVDLESPGGREIVEQYQISTNRQPLFYWFLDDKSKPSKIDSLQDMETMVGHVMSTMATTITERARALGIAMQMGPDKDTTKKPKGGSKKESKEKKTVTITGEAEWEEKVMNNPLVTMVAFAAPWCGHCKMLKPEYDEAAAKVDGEGAQLVWVDATDDANKDLANQFQVQGFPTVLVFPGGAPKSVGAARQYQGERKAPEMVKYILAEVDKSGVPKEIPELVSSHVLQTECKGTNHICVLAALPHILDSGAAGRNNYRDLIANVQKKFRGGAYSFLWFQGGDQPELETSLEMTFGFPAMVAYSMDRHAFAVMRGSFGEKSISSFLHGVTSGRVPVAKLAKEKVPKIETTEPWDGQDAAPPEEEFSLDDIMGSSDDDEEASGGSKEEL